MYSPVNNPPPPDPTLGLQAMAQARIAESADRLEASKMQSLTMQLGITEAGNTGRFQMLSWLTAQLEGLDTKLEIVKENAKVAMSQESNRHTEAIKDLDLRAAEIKRGGTTDPQSFVG